MEHADEVESEPMSDITKAVEIREMCAPEKEEQMPKQVRKSWDGLIKHRGQD